MLLNELILIYNSLTMNEKRYIKLYLNKNTLERQNKYSLIFDYLGRGNSHNEHSIKEILDQLGFSQKNIAADLGYLKKNMLRALNEFHTDKTLNLELYNNLKSIEILFYKGLYAECLKIILKSKKLNAINENENCTLQLLNWEKKCLGYTKGLNKAKFINEKIDYFFYSVKENKTITDLYYRSYTLKNEIGKISNSSIEKKFNLLFRDPIFKKGTQQNTLVQSKIFFNLIKANYYYFKKKGAKERIFLEETITLFDHNPYYKKVNPLDYIAVYIRVIDNYKKFNDPVFFDKIKILRDFEDILELQKKTVKARIYFHTHLLELEYLLHNSNLLHAMELYKKMLDSIEKNKDAIEPYYYIEMYYQFSCLFFIQKKYSESLYYVNTIINEYKKDDNPEFFIKAEIINILLHFNLNNKELIGYLLSQFNSKHKNTYSINYCEEITLLLLQKTIKIPIKKSTALFLEMLNTIKNNQKKLEYSDHVYYEFIKYNAEKK